MIIFRPKNHGFSLIELLITISILGVVAKIAAPSIMDFVSKSNMRAISGDFTMAIQRARSEAINRNQCVVLCMSSSSNSSNKKCDISNTSGSNWGVGWVAFTNPSCAAVTATSPNKSSNTIVFTHEGVNPRYQLNTVSSVRSIIFNPRGLTTIGNGGGFNLVDTGISSNDSINRIFCLDAAGRVITLDYGSSCS